MKNKEPIATLADVINKGIKNRIKDLHTALPGTIVSFDAETQLAAVQPAIKRVFVTREADEDTTEAVDLPQLINVPVVFPRGGGFSLTFPVVPGDECLIMFCERAIDAWHQYGENSEPNARRFHSLSDGVAFVGISSVPNKIPNYDPNSVELKADDEKTVFTLLSDGSAKLYAETKVTVDAPNAEFTGNVKINGNLEVIGASTLSDTVTSNGKDISDTHTHIGSPTAPTGGISNTGTPL